MVDPCYFLQSGKAEPPGIHIIVQDFIDVVIIIYFKFAVEKSGMCKARCRRKGIHARSDEERISLTVAPATVSMIKILRADEATNTRENLDISEFFLYFVRNL